uniref:CSON006501 protein n=1 Tax=Culicoides sonorensis TaxID=179676 RepID=A0A336MTE8_CULSO
MKFSILSLPVICLLNTPANFIKLPTYSAPARDVEDLRPTGPKRPNRRLLKKEVSLDTYTWQKKYAHLTSSVMMAQVDERLKRRFSVSASMEEISKIAEKKTNESQQQVGPEQAALAQSQHFDQLEALWNKRSPPRRRVNPNLSRQGSVADDRIDSSDEDEYMEERQGTFKSPKDTFNCNSAPYYPSKSQFSSLTDNVTMNPNKSSISLPLDLLRIIETDDEGDEDDDDKIHLKTVPKTNNNVLKANNNTLKCCTIHFNNCNNNNNNNNSSNKLRSVAAAASKLKFRCLFLEIVQLTYVKCILRTSIKILKPSSQSRKDLNLNHPDGAVVKYFPFNDFLKHLSLNVYNE